MEDQGFIPDKENSKHEGVEVGISLDVFRRCKENTVDKLSCARRSIIGKGTGKVGKSWMRKASIRNFDCIRSMLENHEKSLERLIIKYDMMEI